MGKLTQKQKIIAGVVASALVLLFASRWFWRGKHLEKVPRAEPAIATPLPPKDLAPEDEHVFVAVALPEQAVDLVSPATGIVAAFPTDPSLPVKAGTVIVKLSAEDVTRDWAEVEALAKQASAEVQKAEAEQHDAEQRFDSRKAEGVVPTSERRSAQIAVQVATANVEVVKQEAAEVQERAAKAKFRVEQLSVKAPFDGVVSSWLISVGATVGPGTRLARFIGSRIPLVRFAVPHEKAARIKVGDHCTFHPDGTLDAAGASLVRIAPEADPQSGLVVVEAAFDKGSGDLRPGTVGKIDLAGDVQATSR